MAGAVMAAGKCSRCGAQIIFAGRWDARVPCDPEPVMVADGYGQETGVTRRGDVVRARVAHVMPRGGVLCWKRHECR